MSETVNIAGLAAKVSESIFSAFNWKLLPVQDENFPCEKVDKHKTKGSGGKHPVDCVFGYPDPFSSKMVFLLCDLKSYAASTIAGTEFGPYIRGISKAIDCAKVSETWKARYVPVSQNDWQIEGLLFVYNHDNDYDASFKEKARGLEPPALPHHRTVRVHLMDPETISYLQSVVKDMKSTCGEFDLDYGQRRFYYPNQLINVPGECRMQVATIEMLRGRLLIAVLKERLTGFDRYFVYLRSKGSLQDFEYIVTYLYRHGVMELANDVFIRGTDFGPTAQTNFENAKQAFLERHYKMKEIRISLEKIKFGRVDRVQNSFSTDDVARLRKP